MYEGNGYEITAMRFSADVVFVQNRQNMHKKRRATENK